VPETAIRNIGGIPLFSVRHSPLQGWNVVVKRVFDLAVSSILLLMMSPFLLLCAAIVKFDSPGPILYKQQRVGLDGRRFNLYKFRSMKVEAEQESGPVWARDGDNRCTRFGRWFRRFNIDELPQLFNVFRGDMSLVGPRPPIPSEVMQYDWWQRRRLSVRPGLTCTWQVSGRNAIGFEQWMEMDLAYIDGWNLALDMKIMAKTVKEVMRGGGA
jgi:exopolysaccharide biosynthesis polyprenyl glycosylphosphotransferase